MESMETDEAAQGVKTQRSRTALDGWHVRE